MALRLSMLECEGAQDPIDAARRKAAAGAGAAWCFFCSGARITGFVAVGAPKRTNAMEPSSNHSKGKGGARHSDRFLPSTEGCALP